MEVVELLRLFPLPRTRKATGQWIVAGLLALGIVTVLAACGTQAASSKAILDAYTEAIAAGDVEAALAVFTDDAQVATDSHEFNGASEIRNWVDNEIRFFGQAGGECAAWTNVKETADTMVFDERCTTEEGVWEGHHAYVFEDGKIKTWTMSFKQLE